MTNRGPPVVGMTTNVPGQQMFPQHLQPMQMQAVYPGVGISPLGVGQNAMYLSTGQMPMFPPQTRHQNPANSAAAAATYYPQHGPHILMTQMPFAGYTPAHAGQHASHYYYTRPAPAGAGPPTAGPGAQQVVGAPGPTGAPQAMPLLQMGAAHGLGGPPVGPGDVSGPPSQGPPGPPSAQHHVGSGSGARGKSRRPNALEVIDPKTGACVDIYESGGSGTPPRSGESSARETPQPNTGQSLDVVADFAARVAKAASEKTSPPPQQAPLQAQPTQAQGPPPPFPSDTQPVVNGPENDKGLSPEELPSRPPGVKPGNDVMAEVFRPMPVHTDHQPIPTITNKELQDVGGTPVVSARTNAPAVEVVHHSRREHFPALKGSSGSAGPGAGPTVAGVTGPPSTASPRRKPAASTPQTVASQEKPPTAAPVQQASASIVPPISVVLGPPAVPASAEPKPAPVVSASSQQAPPPVTASAPKKQGPPPQVDVPAFPPKDGPKTSAPVVRVGTGPPPGAKTVTPVSSATSNAPDAVPPRAGGKPPARKEVPSSAIPVHRDGPPAAVRAPKAGDLPSAVSRPAAPVSTPRPPSRSPTPPVLPPAAPHAQTTVPPPSSSPAPAPAAVPAEESRPNGEVPEPAPQQPESGKPSSRSKSKRNPHHRMREQNKKGAEKEGTDMDAFTEPPSSTPASTPTPAPASAVENATPAEELASLPPPPTTVPARVSTPPVAQAAAPQAEKQQPPPPTSPAPPVAPARAASPPPRPSSPAPEIALPIKEKEKEKEKEKGEEETEGEKEQKIVAARNEANAKVSAAALKEKKEDEIIENIPPKPVLPVPKQMYREDQWSPFNPDGKKKYERDFLIKLKDTTEAKKKPEIRPDVLNLVLKDKVNRPRLPDLSRGPHDNFTPAFTKSQSFRGQPVTKRGSQQGKAKSGAKPPIIQYSLKTDVKLRETENAWKPARLRGSQAEQDKTADLYKKVRGVLNKLTPQKFHTLVQQVQALPIDNSERLHGVIDLVFEKAVDEPSYSVAYAQMCKVLSNMQVADGSKEGQPENFRKLLLSRCQHEFEKNTQADLKRDERLKEIEQCTDPEKKKELQLEFEETERRLRMKSVGNIRFVGELFKLGMLTSNIMHRCIQHLLKQRDEESLECLCKLLTTIGKDVESKKHDLSKYFEEMKSLSKQRGQISSRVRFMLQDVIELRDNKWVPRRDDSAPKTIDQIQREAERESMMEMQAPSGGGGGSRGGGGGRDDRGGDRRKRGGPSEDGWQSVQRKNLDTSKLRIKPSDLVNVSLGGSNQFAAWTQGAGGNSDSDRGSAFPQTSNTFAALQDVEDKKSGVGLFSRPYGKQPPSSNTEREKAVNSLRNFVSAEKEERQARTASSGTPSRSSSREGSSARQTPALSSSQSRDDLAAAAQPVASGSSAISDRDTRKNLPHLSQDQVAKKIQFIMEEFVNNNNYQESALSVSETFPPSNMGNFVVETMNMLLERTAPVRCSVGKLMAHLMKEGILTTEQFLEGFKEIAEVADDLAIDVPKVWLYLAEILVPMLSTEALSFTDLKTAATGLHKLVVEILSLLVKDKGPGWIRQRWDAAGMSWKDFAPADSIDRIVKENKLEFTVGPAGDTVALSPEAIHAKLLQLLRPEQGTPAATDEVTKWISANVGERAKTPEFIRVLTTAVCESAYQASSSKKFEETLFSKHSSLLQMYIDTNEELELHCLYAVQELNHRLEQPSGLLCSLFQSLWDYGCVANETFLKWEQSKDPAFLQGKGIALKSLTAFFTALREADDDSSEECPSGQ